MDDILVDGDKPQFTAKGANTLRGGKRQYSCRTLQGNYEEQRYEPGVYGGREFGSFVTEESARQAAVAGKQPRVFGQRVMERLDEDSRGSRYDYGNTILPDKAADPTKWTSTIQASFRKSGAPADETVRATSGTFKMPLHPLKDDKEQREKYRLRWITGQLPNATAGRFRSSMAEAQAGAVAPRFRPAPTRKLVAVPKSMEVLRERAIARHGAWAPVLLRRAFAVAQMSDGKAGLSQTELVTLLQDAGLSMTVDEADEVFLFLDSDGSGSVSWREFVRILTRGGAPPGAEALARGARRQARATDASLRAGKGIMEATAEAEALAKRELSGRELQEEKEAEAALDPVLTPARRAALEEAFEDLARRYRADPAASTGAGSGGAGSASGSELPFGWAMRQCDASQLPPVLMSAEAKAALAQASGSSGLPAQKKGVASAVPNDLAKGGGAQALSLLVGGCERLARLAGSVACGAGSSSRGSGVRGSAAAGGGGESSAATLGLGDFMEMHEGMSMQEEDDGAFSLRIGLVWRVDSLATKPGSVAAAGPRGKAAAEATTSLAVLAVLASGERVLVSTKPGPFFRRGDRATERILVEEALRAQGKDAGELVRWSFDF